MSIVQPRVIVLGMIALGAVFLQSCGKGEEKKVPVGSLAYCRQLRETQESRAEQWS